MREVIILKPSTIERVTVEMCSPKNLYYGARKRQSPGWRGVVVRENYRAPAKYQLRCFDEFTKGNLWTTKETQSFEMFLRNLIAEDWEVMQFDTMWELTEWLSV